MRWSCNALAPALGSTRGVIRVVAASAFILLAAAPFGGIALAADTLHFAVGPLQPTPGETKKAFEPFFKSLADALGVRTR